MRLQKWLQNGCKKNAKCLVEKEYELQNFEVSNGMKATNMTIVHNLQIQTTQSINLVQQKLVLL